MRAASQPRWRAISVTLSGGGQVREQAAVLDDVADAAAQRLDVVRRQRPPVDAHLAGVGRAPAPTSRRSTVDLPQPDGPSSAVVLPDANVRSMPSTAARAP